MLVVLDCNVIVSAGLTDGTFRAVIREVAARHRCVLSQEILTEYREVIARPKFRLPAGFLRPTSRPVRKHIRVCRAGCFSVIA